MMVRILVLALGVLLFCNDPALAGAWPRAKGDSFVSAHVSSETESPTDITLVSGYGEYGLTNRFTLGGGLDYDVTQKDIPFAQIFGRWHFPDSEGALRKALSLGIEGNEENQFLTPAFHLGRGFETALGPGWLDVEFSAQVSTDTWGSDFGAYALVGLKPHKRVMTMMALDVLTVGDSVQINAIPSVAWEFGDGRHMHLEWTRAVEGAIKDEVALGLWLEF